MTPLGSLFLAPLPDFSDLVDLGNCFSWSVPGIVGFYKALQII